MTGITDSAGRSVTVAYNGAGKISSVTDNASRVWSYAYDGNGRLSTMTNPLSGVTTYTYTTDGKLLTVVDPRSNTKITNVFGSFGRLDEAAGCAEQCDLLRLHLPAGPDRGHRSARQEDHALPG